MELRHLRYFLTAADQMSFTRAADTLRITQSTLSHQIKQLENETGPLFDRAGRGIRLTSRGRVFKGYAERIVSDVRTSVSALAELDNLVRGQLSIGVYRCFENSPLPPVLTAFSQKYPNVEMRVHAGNHVDLTQRLIDGSLDLAVSYAPTVSEKVVAETIFVEPLALVVGRQHPSFGRPSIAVNKLAGESLISVSFENRQRQSIQRCLAARGIVPRVIIEVNSNEAVLAMVKCSAYATICPDPGVPGLHAIPLNSLPLKRSTLMLWRRDNHRSAAATAIASMIKAAFSNRQSEIRSRRT
jgi:LysR family transcriptional regulator, cyn operon transcriptional activator